MSTSFIARAKGTPKGGDDSARGSGCKTDERPGKLVFDHALIVSDYQTYKQTGKRPPPRR
jgi:8-oxo-dGTP diphosphatase